MNGNLESRITLIDETNIFPRETGRIIIYRDPEQENETDDYGLIVNTRTRKTFHDGIAVAILQHLEDQDAKGVLRSIEKRVDDQYCIALLDNPLTYSRERRDEIRDILKYVRSHRERF